jgi:hypothetical protein
LDGFWLPPDINSNAVLFAAFGLLVGKESLSGSVAWAGYAFCIEAQFDLSNSI